LGVIFELVREINTSADKGFSANAHQASLETLNKLTGLLGLLNKQKGKLDEEIEALIQEREKARAEKNWALADKIRDDLKKEGIILEDTPQGVRWKRV
jgi:cysteinyl-tRNA synthetase